MPLTASQIVQDACQIAKCPGYTAQGGRCLNLVLQDLVLHRNLKVNLISNQLTFGANSFGPFNLESNYLRTYDMFYNVSGTPYFLNPSSLKQFDSENFLSGISNYPYEFATDLSGVPTNGYGLLYIYPSSSTEIVVTHRYYLEQADIDTPQTSAVVPWFSDSDYLVHATALRLMRITDDERYPVFVKEAEMMLKLHLMEEGDEQQVVKEVQLDPRRFRVASNSKPTKLDPY